MSRRKVICNSFRLCIHHRSTPAVFTPLLYKSSDTSKCYSNWSYKNKSNRRSHFLYGFASVTVLGLTALVHYKLKNDLECYAEEQGDLHDTDDIELAGGQIIDHLPYYKKSEVKEHNTIGKKIWVTYKNGVYDITEFVEHHPGGDKILLAAGSSVEPFWMLYGVHKNPDIIRLLEEYRIGNLDPEEIGPEVSPSDPYLKDPQRHPILIPASLKPFNGEPPVSVLTDYFCTPNGVFYVRNHLPVPVVDGNEYKLEVKGLGVETKSFTLKELKKFPKHTITATVQCAGNRRSEMVIIKPVKGLNWNQGAIGNATWSGVRLTDLLKECKFQNSPEIEHVHFEGLDRGPDNEPYAASVPAEKVLDPQRDVILAYEMNGEELPRDHGYPVRVIVPGIVGARNVKWVSKIILAKEESTSHWQRNDYKGFSPSTDWDTVDFTKSPAIQELPVNSAICQPQNGDVVEVNEGSIFVKGYAWSGGGNPVVRVDITTNKGKTWYVADLVQAPDKANRRWAWTLWSADVPVEAEAKEVEIWVKAVDSSYNTQPESFENIWNLRGVLGNAYHKIRVKLSDG